jgi:hypothetical protein
VSESDAELESGIEPEFVEQALCANSLTLNLQNRWGGVDLPAEGLTSAVLPCLSGDVLCVGSATLGARSHTACVN